MTKSEALATPAEPVNDWDDVLTAETAPENVFVRGARVDVEKDVPEPIRKMIETSLAEYKAPSEPKKKDGHTHYFVYDAKTPQRAAEFRTLAQKYGKYRKDEQITVRATIGKYVTEGDKKIWQPVKKDEAGTVVKFAGKPLEKRSTNRLPGSDVKEEKAPNNS